jgi:hypothetical protein
MTCRNPAATPACFAPAAGGQIPVTAHYVYDVDAVLIATAYALADGTVIDPATHLGGGIVTAGPCPGLRPASLGGVVSLPVSSAWSSPAGARSVSIVPVGSGVTVTGPDGIANTVISGVTINSSTRPDQADWLAGAWAVSTNGTSTAQIVWEAV